MKIQTDGIIFWTVSTASSGFIVVDPILELMNAISRSAQYLGFIAIVAFKLSLFLLCRVFVRHEIILVQTYIYDLNLMMGGVLQERSSTGRAAASNSEGCGFKSCRSCKAPLEY